MKIFYKYVIVLAVLLLMIGAPLVWLFRVELTELLQLARHQAEELGKINPIVLIAAIAILPAVGFPVSIFYIIGSIAYGVVWGLVYSGIGVALNISLCYWIANSFFRKWIVSYIGKRGHKAFGVPKAQQRSTVIAVRLMPGIPLSVHNYILGVAAIPFKKYLIYSWPIEMFWAVFFILAANTAIKQTTESVILVLLGVLAVGLLIRVFRSIAKEKES